MGNENSGSKKPNDFEAKAKDIIAYSIDGKKKNASHCGQDTYSIISYYVGNIRIRFFAVYDGHGDKGKIVSENVNKHIERFIKMMKNKIITWDSQEVILNQFTNQFTELQNAMTNDPETYESSGTCAICVLIIDSSVYVINLGDSRAVLGSQSNNEIYAIEMSEDHKPEVADEIERIIRSGGEVTNQYDKTMQMQNAGIPFRVFKKGESSPGLAIARSLGDLYAHDVGVIEIPQISRKLVEQYDDFIVIGSDGLYDVISSVEIVKFIYDRLGKMSKETIVKLLVNEARNRWEIINKFKLVLFTERHKSITGTEQEKKQIKVTTNPTKTPYSIHKNILSDFQNDSQVEIQNYQNNLIIDDITCVICFFKK